MEYIQIIFRIIIYYFFIILIYRIMGKREVGQLGIVDLIVSILIAELVTISVEDTNKSMLTSIIPIIVLVILQVSLSYASLKKPKIRSMLDGNPSFIIKNGQVKYNEMIKQKYNLDDLLTQLREKGYRCIEEIEYAILENNGTLSVFPYQKQKRTPFPMPVILDGKIQYSTLKEINKDLTFIKNILQSKKLTLQNIFYAFYQNKSFYIITYNDLKKE